MTILETSVSEEYKMKKILSVGMIGLVGLSGLAGCAPSEPEVVYKNVTVTETVEVPVEVIKEVPVNVTVEKIVEVDNGECPREEGTELVRESCSDKKKDNAVEAGYHSSSVPEIQELPAKQRAAPCDNIAPARWVDVM